MRRRYPELYAEAARWVAVVVRETLFELERIRPVVEAAGVTPTTPEIEDLKRTVISSTPDRGG
jgi:hypothetical protein